MASSDVRVESRRVVLSADLRIHYLEAEPISESKGTLLLVHGYPESSYQFRLVIKPLAAAGYRVIAPDYTGHGMSSKPVRDVAGFTKARIAQDLYAFLQEGLGIKSPIHLIGHDIGGMIAFVFVMQYPEFVKSIVWGECPLPGTSEYYNFRYDVNHWHFGFQGGQPDMAAWLVQGKERPYIKQFYDRFAYKPGVFTPEVVDHYVGEYSTPGALQCAFYVYSAFELDAEQNKEWLSAKGKVKTRNLILTGSNHALAAGAQGMAAEAFENVNARFVPEAGHYIAEENPEGFVEQVLKFLAGN